MVEGAFVPLSDDFWARSAGNNGVRDRVDFGTGTRADTGDRIDIR